MSRPNFLVLMLYLLPDSLFMSIGSVIRTEGPHNDAWLRARGPPMMLPRRLLYDPCVSRRIILLLPQKVRGRYVTTRGDDLYNIIYRDRNLLYCREQDTRCGYLLLDGCKMSAQRRDSPYLLYITWRHRTLGRMEGASSDALFFWR